MRLTLSATGSVLAVAFGLCAAAPAGAVPPKYSFHMSVVMAMRHFPWLHFHMTGDGEYVAGQSYQVHFTSAPWFFPPQRHDVDLSMLDPAMWPGRFITTEIDRGRNGERLVLLHAVADPTLRDATVTLGPFGRTRVLDINYTDGAHIEMNVAWSTIEGFVLPSNLTATIDEPHLALSANADFNDYRFDE